MRAIRVHGTWWPRSVMKNFLQHHLVFVSWKLFPLQYLQTGLHTPEFEKYVIDEITDEHIENNKTEEYQVVVQILHTQQLKRVLQVDIRSNYQQTIESGETNC